MKTISAVEDKDYKGPVAYKAIMRQIVEDAKKQGLFFVPERIGYVIRMFFSKNHGVTYFMKHKAISVTVDGLGVFWISAYRMRSVKREFEAEEKKLLKNTKDKKKPKARKKMTWQRREKIRRYGRIKKRKERAKKKYALVNQERINAGLQPYTDVEIVNLYKSHIARIKRIKNYRKKHSEQ